LILRVSWTGSASQCSYPLPLRPSRKR